jgi:predicted DCC family thiol-disulfide oxidoreductase YuxK
MPNGTTDQLDVIYNDTCPICSREVAHYQKKTGDDVVYHGLSRADLSRFGLTEEGSAREFHVMHEGRLVSGLEAFALLWERMPRMRWLARFVRLPVVRPVAGMIYGRVLAPALFAMHKRRQRRRKAEA